MKRLIVVFSSVLVCLCIGISPVYATESEQKAVVTLAALEVETDYNASDVTIIREEDTDSNEVRATVIDKTSGEILEKYCEKPEVPVSMLTHKEDVPFCTLSTRDNYNTVLRKTCHIASPSGVNVSTIVWAEVNVTAGQSWGQIEYVRAAGQNATSGAYTLEGPYTYSRTASFPTNRVSIGYQGTVMVARGNTLGISYGGVQTAGFTISGSVSGMWYARKFYSGFVTLSLR